MSLSRVALGLHFLSDVAGGAALGIAAGAAWLLWF
jgi:membrane-associated phospholipid phosphatase